MARDYKDYYSVLGVNKKASDKEIKTAFQKLARKYHPDVNPGDAGAEERFKEVSEAYEVLSDPEKRKKYDQFGDQWKAFSQQGGGFPGGAGPGGFRVDFGGNPGQFADLNDLFATLFADDVFGRGGGGRGGRMGGDPFAGMRGGAPTPARGQDVEASLQVTLEEAYHGATRSLSLQVPSGRYDLDRGGTNATTRRVEVKVPAGVADGQKIRLSGQGGEGPGGRGDLYLVVKIAPHPAFERKGDDLYVDVPVPYTDAALGGEAKVPTLKGSRLSMRIPAGTQSGQAFRLSGQGMPRLRGGGFGDLYARAKITVPKALSDRERELLEELARLRRRAASEEPAAGAAA
jgi:DnaJ-class molecular chaperone with C-terminal Zn finger domain